MTGLGHPLTLLVLLVGGAALVAAPFLKHRPRLCMALTGLGMALLPIMLVSITGEQYWLRVTINAGLYVMLALGLNIVVGYAGLLDLGYIAFYAVGAYLYAILASPHLADNPGMLAQHWPVWIILPLGAALAATFGVLLGTPTLRLRGDYLAIVTLGFGEIIRVFMQNLDRPFNLTNGSRGISQVDPISLGGFSLHADWSLFGIQVSYLFNYYYLFLLLAVLIIVVTMRLENSRLGRAWMAIREDEIAAQAMGINTRNVKLLAFAMGASFGGVAGCLFASLQGFVHPSSFALDESIIVLCAVVLGGMGHIPGVILGAVLLSFTPEILREVVAPARQEALFGQVLIAPEDLRILLFGLTLILIMRFRPEGIWPSRRRQAELHQGEQP